MGLRALLADTNWLIGPGIFMVTNLRDRTGSPALHHGTSVHDIYIFDGSVLKKEILYWHWQKKTPSAQYSLFAVEMLAGIGFSLACSFGSPQGSVICAYIDKCLNHGEEEKLEPKFEFLR